MFAALSGVVLLLGAAGCAANNGELICGENDRMQLTKIIGNGFALAIYGELFYSVLNQGTKFSGYFPRDSYNSVDNGHLLFKANSFG